MNNTPMPGYLFKVRVGDDWIPIPILTQTLYDAYCDYCATQTPALTPVSEQTYYASVGELQSLITALATNLNALLEFSENLDSGQAFESIAKISVTYNEVETEPADWSQHWTNYYYFDDTTNTYKHFTEAEAPEWGSVTVYQMLASFQAIADNELATKLAEVGAVLTSNPSLDIDQVLSTINTQLNQAATTEALNAFKAKFSVGTAQPSGGQNGDYYFQY